MLTTTSPFSFILFGASGNLAKLKLYPALYTLALKKRLPEQYAIIGYSRTEMSQEEFRTLVAESIKTDMLEVNRQKLDAFLSHVHYHAGQYDNEKDFEALHDRLTELEKGWEKTVRLTYLSIPPSVIPAVLHNICSAGIHTTSDMFRCIVEKPVGHDHKSFEIIKKQLTSCLSGKEIYLLDHYLGKEAVRNTYYLRYANPMLETLFKNTLIHHVEVTASESLGIEGRAGYFEHTGTFRDMFQSHLLMMLSLLTMHVQKDDEHLTESRHKALEQFYLPETKKMEDVVLQAQYAPGEADGKQVKGYTEEEGVKPDSRTNTYAALKLMSKEPRWKGVPFYLHSGKRLKKKETRISIQFQEPHPVGKGSAPNRLDIILQGEAGMRIHLQTKIGGTEPAFRPLILDDPLVCIGDCLPEHALLILEAIKGKKHWFLSFEEVSTAWHLVDPLQSYLDQKDTPLHTYPAGSKGPEAADAWIKKSGLEWF